MTDEARQRMRDRLRVVEERLAVAHPILSVKTDAQRRERERIDARDRPYDGPMPRRPQTCPRCYGLRPWWWLGRCGEPCNYTHSNRLDDDAEGERFDERLRRWRETQVKGA